MLRISLLLLLSSVFCFSLERYVSIKESMGVRISVLSVYQKDQGVHVDLLSCMFTRGTRTDMPGGGFADIILVGYRVDQ